jgi:hypothetical protein
VIELFAPQLVRSGAPTCVLCNDKTMNGLNCTCSVERMWLYRASQGRLNVSVCHIRDLTNDCTGGTNLGQMKAVSESYGITTGKLYQPIDFDQVAAWVSTGRYASHLNISYGPLAGTSYDRFFDRFFGNHDIFLSGPGASSSSLSVGDPGATTFHDIPKSLLKTAAGRLALETDSSGRTTLTLNERYGSGKAYAYVTPIDPAVSTTRYHVAISGKTALYSSPGGSVVGSVTKASYTVLRAKSGGLWWYQILASSSGNNKRWFKPTRYTRITVI